MDPEKDLLYIEEFISPYIVAENLANNLNWQMQSYDNNGVDTFLFIEERSLYIDIKIEFCRNKIKLIRDNRYNGIYRNNSVSDLESCKAILKDYIRGD